MAYTNIKSAFIKAEIQKTKWKDRDYIDGLIKIERFAQGSNCGLYTGYLRNHLRGSYPRQWKKIWLEVNPQRYTKNLEQEEKVKEKEQKEKAKFRREEARELKQKKKEWIKVGGIPFVFGYFCEKII